MFVTITGLIAGALTTFSLVPQLIRILRTKHTRDLSLKTYVILTIGVFLWVVYGVFIKDSAVIIANGVTFLLGASIIALKIKYG